MFKALRRMILPIILIALTGFLATIIFQWGMDLSSRQDYLSGNLAAVINGEEISWQDYNRAYSTIYQRESRNYEDDIPDAKIREMQSAAWNQLLYDRLVMQEVAQHNITVTNEELYGFLRYSPPADLQQIDFFRTDGQFDYQKYLSYMVDPQAASFWASVEPVYRVEIMKMKLQEMVTQAANITEAEIKDAFLTSREKVKVGLVNVPNQRFATFARAVTDEEIQQYFENNREDYMVDERAVLKVSMISKAPKPSDWEKVRLAAQEVRDSAVAGADFAQLAMDYSEDNSANSGGNLGWFPEGQMVPEFNNKVFSMKKGEISEPIRTNFGWHIIKLHDTRNGDEKEVHASHILLKVRPSQATLEDAYFALDNFRSEAASSDFETAATAADIEINETRPFERGSAIQYIGRDQFLENFAFDNEVGNIAAVMENNSAVYIVQVSQHLPAGLADFKDTKSEAKIDLITDKMLQLCMDTANAIYSDYETGKDLKKAARRHDAKYVELDPFARNGYTTEFGRDPKALGGAFALKEAGQVSRPIDHEKGVAIFELIEKISPDLTEFTAKRDSIQSALLVNKQQELYSRWFEQLRDNSEIVNNIQFGRVRSNN